MLRTPRILAILMTFALAACSETPNAPPSVFPPGGVIPPGPPPNLSAQLTGKVTIDGLALDNAVYLELDDQSRVILVGSQVIGLSSVNGAVVFVEGNWSDGYALDNAVVDVQRFEVLAIGGRPAVDGVLEQTEEGYALRLQSGDLYALIDPPAPLLEHMGQRLWITMGETGVADAFGVISN